MAFQLKPNKKETENKTIRFPVPLLERIDKAIENKDVTFSSFVIQACEYALEDLEDMEKGSINRFKTVKGIFRKTEPEYPWFMIWLIQPLL